MDELEKLRTLCAEVYQVVGSLAVDRDDDALVPTLDNLAAAAQGDDLPHATLLPFPGGPHR